jgi:NitT/TauT family transport system substrate-binding protein
MMRRLSFGFIAGLIAGLVLSPVPVTAQEKLIVGYSNLRSAKVPIPLAKEAGLFAKHGLDVTLIRMSPGRTAVPKLIAGDIHLFLGNGHPVVKAIVKDGARLAVIASLGEDGFSLVAGPAIRDAATLKGKRVGISRPGSSADRVARLAVKALGLDPDKDVRMVATDLNNSKARLDLLLKGGIDATIVSTGNIMALGDRRSAVSSVAELEDLGIFVSGADISTTRSFIQTRRATVKRFLAAVVEGVARAKADPELAARMYSKYGGESEPEVLAWRSREFVRTRIPTVPVPKRRALAAYLADAGRTGAPDYDAVADFSLLQEVVAGK